MNIVDGKDTIGWGGRLLVYNYILPEESFMGQFEAKNVELNNMG